MFEIIEAPGAVVRREDRDAVAIFDGRKWIEVPNRLLVDKGMTAEELAQVHGKITPEAIAELEAWVAEWEEEQDRLKLRQLLAETQEEDDEDE